jgi:hypothetical protein
MATAAVQPHEEVCPWCHQHISRARFLQIQARIREEEKRRLEQLEADMRAKLASEREVLETRFKADKTSLDLQVQQLREKVEKANEEKAEFERRLKQAAADAALAERKKLEAELAAKHQAERAKERELMKSDYDKQRLKDDAEAQKATKALQKQVADLQKKLEEQAAAKPEVVDIDVVEQLKTEFKGDRVLKLPKADKSDSGGDVLVEVKYKNAVCGKILIDSRVRGNWQSSYAAKLRTDMVEQKAEHAILSTVHFPKGAGDLHRHDDVLLVHPARVTELVGILRQTMIRMFQARLSNEQRAEKKAKLYDHITSDAFRRKLTDAEKTTQDVLDIDAEELEAHQKVWKKRGLALKKLQTLQKQVVAEIDDIVDGIEDDDGHGN